METSEGQSFNLKSVDVWRVAAHRGVSPQCEL